MILKVSKEAWEVPQVTRYWMDGAREGPIEGAWHKGEEWEPPFEEKGEGVRNGDMKAS